MQQIIEGNLPPKEVRKFCYKHGYQIYIEDKVWAINPIPTKQHIAQLKKLGCNVRVYRDKTGLCSDFADLQFETQECVGWHD
jgi:hypothetical protein